MKNKALYLVWALAACQAAPELTAPPQQVVIRADYSEPIGPPAPPFVEYHLTEIKNGDAFSVALQRLGLKGAEAEEAVQALSGRFDFRYLKPGQILEIKRAPDGKVSWVKLDADPTTIWLALRDSDGRLVAYKEPVKVTTSTRTVEGAVEYSLYTSILAQGEEPWLTLTLVDVFSWDIDFFTETQDGDNFKIVVEKRWVGEQFIGYGAVLGAEYAFATGTRRHRAFRYVFEDGRTGYYTEDGQAVEKAFLKSPIKFASITSRYGMRRHPILQYVRAHRGVDYGAPQGTAVWAVGEGVVSQAGYSGGYGKLVAVRHANGLESRYAHLRDFGSGIKVGKRVAQKEVIGYVGKTGLATGPHLHFEILRNGAHMNPLVMAAPPAPPISPEELPRFLAQVAPIVRSLTGTATLAATLTSTGAP